MSCLKENTKISLKSLATDFFNISPDTIYRKSGKEKYFKLLSWYCDFEIVDKKIYVTKIYDNSDFSSDTEYLLNFTLKYFQDCFPLETPWTIRQATEQLKVYVYDEKDKRLDKMNFGQLSRAIYKAKVIDYGTKYEQGRIGWCENVWVKDYGDDIVELFTDEDKQKWREIADVYAKSNKIVENVIEIVADELSENSIEINKEDRDKVFEQCKKTFYSNFIAPLAKILNCKTIKRVTVLHLGPAPAGALKVKKKK